MLKTLKKTFPKELAYIIYRMAKRTHRPFCRICFHCQRRFRNGFVAKNTRIRREALPRIFYADVFFCKNSCFVASIDNSLYSTPSTFDGTIKIEKL